MRIAVVREKPAGDVDPRSYVEFSVSISGASGQVMGWWFHAAAIANSAPGSLTANRSQGDGKPVAEMWEEAIAYASSQGVQVIWLDDPEKLFHPGLEN